MLPLIIAGSVLGGAVGIKVIEYSVSYVRSRYAPAVKPKKNTRRKKPEAAATAEAKPKNVRRASALVEQADAATKKVMASDTKPPEKVAQGRPSLAAQIAALPGMEKT